MEFFSELLGAITNCISDTDPVVRERAGEANKDLLELVQVTHVPPGESSLVDGCVVMLWSKGCFAVPFLRRESQDVQQSRKLPGSPSIPVTLRRPSSLSSCDTIVRYNQSTPSSRTECFELLVQYDTRRGFVLILGTGVL